MGRAPPIIRSPDSAAGRIAAAEEEQLLRKVFFSHPPDKRQNFLKLGTPSPFGPRWDTLAKEYLGEAAPFFVMRGTAQLDQFARALRRDADSPGTLVIAPEEKSALVPGM